MSDKSVVPGDIVSGIEFREKTEVMILVERVALAVGEPISVSGKIITDGKHISRRKGVINIASGGWVIIRDFVPEKQTESLAEKIRTLDIKGTIDIKKSDHKTNTVRVTASVIADNEGMKFTVNKTPDGCTVIRIA